MATSMWTLVCLMAAAGALPADVAPMNQRNFKIPIRIDAPRAEIKQLVLYQSTDQGRQWSQVGQATPDKDGFPFFAESDGLFWFSVQTHFHNGRKDPEDLMKTPPGMKVLIDTAKPVVRIVSAERQGEEIVVSWEAQDPNADLDTLKLESKPVDGVAWAVWTVVPITPGPSGTVKMKGQPGAVSLRLQMQDYAGNVGSAQTDVAAAPPPMTTTHTTVNAGGAPPPSFPKDNDPPSNTRSKDASGSPFELPASTGNTAKAGPWTMPDKAGGSEPIQRVVATSGPDAPASPIVPGPRMPRGPMPALQIINETRLNLEYEVTKHGPSGVGGVELWVTQDDGRSWKMLSNDADPKPPITIDLPQGDGIYGFRLVVRSKAGLSKGPPLVGEAPELRVEVDTTPPVVQLYEPKPDASRRDMLLISWNASDKNLGTNPIAIEWADPRDANKWKPIGSNLPNAGFHNWQLPPGLPYNVLLRVSARDVAGNLAVAETPEPILVDLTKPEGRIIGITGVKRVP